MYIFLPVFVKTARQQNTEISNPVNAKLRNKMNNISLKWGFPIYDTINNTTLILISGKRIKIDTADRNKEKIITDNSFRFIIPPENKKIV